MKRKFLVLSVWLAVAGVMGIVGYAKYNSPIAPWIQSAYCVCAIWLIVAVVWVKHIDDREWRQRLEQLRDRW